MSVATYNYVGPEEVVELTKLVMYANKKKAVHEASINIYKDFVSLTISNSAEATFYIDFKHKQEQITDLLTEKENYYDYEKCKDLLESLIKKNGGKYD